MDFGSCEASNLITMADLPPDSIRKLFREIKEADAFLAETPKILAEAEARQDEAAKQKEASIHALSEAKRRLQGDHSPSEASPVNSLQCRPNSLVIRDFLRGFPKETRDVSGNEFKDF